MSGYDPLLVQTGGGFSLRYGERWLYSRHQPRISAEKAAEALAVEADTLYLLISPCLCHGLEILAARLPDSSAVFGMELEAGLLPIARAGFDGLQLDPSRFRLCSSPEPGAILAEASDSGKFRRVRELRLSGGRDLHSQDYDGLVETITLNNRLAWRNHMTLVRLGRLWVKNVIINLAAMPWEEVAIPEKVQKPVMLCGAGPSLNRVLPWMKQHAGQLMIMAVDTAAGTLVQAGIHPDQLVCLEAQAHNLPDFTPLAGLEVTLMADISANPATFRIVRGQKQLVSSQWMSCRFLDRLAKAGLPIQLVPPLGSVGVLAARLAVQHGSIILLAGLDFSFQRAITHCKGSPTDLAERRTETRLYKRAGSWALSCGPGVDAQPDGSLGNAILSMYAGCAGVELKGAAVYDLRGGFGLPLPAAAISLEQAEALLHTKRRKEEDSSLPHTSQLSAHDRVPDTGNSLAGTAAGISANTAGYKAAAAAFLENELRLAQELAERLRTHTTEPLEGILRECDYMYAHFPDPQRVQTLEIDALKRLAIEAGYWQQRLQTALKLARA